MTDIVGLKLKLRLLATRRHGDIRPVSGKASLDQCYNVMPRTLRNPPRLVFWYNDSITGSTHIADAPIPESEIEYVRLAVAS